jgi:hypothetical protein
MHKKKISLNYLGFGNGNQFRGKIFKEDIVKLQLKGLCNEAIQHSPSFKRFLRENMNPRAKSDGKRSASHW